MNARVNLQTQPDAPVPLQAQRSCVRYEAQTELGTWRLRLALDDAHGASHSAAVAAQALLRAEDLLLALDTWCVHAGLGTLAWTWPAIAERQSDVGDHGRAARARWLGDATGITFGAPWAALRRLGAPPPDLQAALRWDVAWAACVLDRLTLDAESEAGLEPGGAVLIAPSLGAPWRGALRGAGEADDAGLVLDLAAAEGGVAIVATPVHSADVGSIAAGWEIRSLHPVRVSVPVLCGWAPPEAPWPRALFTELELARCGAGLAPRPTMPGRLMPWGRGVAMLLGQ